MTEEAAMLIPVMKEGNDFAELTDPRSHPRIRPKIAGQINRGHIKV
jgi:hypothetical protein